MKVTLASLALVALLGEAALADTATLNGNTSGAPTFNRPTEAGSPSLFTVSYKVYQFNVTASGAFNFVLNAVDPSSYDTFLHLYLGAFNPAESSANFLAANDDRDVNDPALGSGLSNVPLTVGNSYFLVLDGFGSTDSGAFTATISGPGAINVVPEPSALALVSGGILGLVALLRWRARRSS